MDPPIKNRYGLLPLWYPPPKLSSLVVAVNSQHLLCQMYMEPNAGAWSYKLTSPFHRVSSLRSSQSQSVGDWTFSVCYFLCSCYLHFCFYYCFLSSFSCPLVLAEGVNFVLRLYHIFLVLLLMARWYWTLLVFQSGSCWFLNQ